MLLPSPPPPSPPPSKKERNHQIYICHWNWSPHYFNLFSFGNICKNCKKSLINSPETVLISWQGNNQKKKKTYFSFLRYSIQLANISSFALITYQLNTVAAASKIQKLQPKPEKKKDINSGSFSTVTEICFFFLPSVSKLTFTY